MERVLVTGGCGFIGSHVVDRLVDAGVDVRVLDSLHPLSHREEPGYLNRAADYVFGDVCDAEVVTRCLDGIDTICHQAAMVGLGLDVRDVVDYVRHNDLGTAVLLRALAGAPRVRRLVLASSMVVYGEGRYRCAEHGVVTPGPRRPEQLEAGAFDPPCPVCARQLEAEPVPEGAPLDPRNVYAATKVHQEHLCGAVARETGLPLTILRYHNVYGARMPRDTPYAGVASLFRSALEVGRPPQVFEDGSQLRDFIHVDDVAEANVRALEAEPVVEGAFNVASGDPRTVLDLARALAAGFDEAPAPEVTGRYRLGDVRHVFASPALASERLRFKARTSFADGMRAFARAELR